VIIENERDERTAAWLIETYGAEAVAEAETRIAGERRPYPSNIAKVLGVSLPESLKRTENAAARQKLAELRRMLEGKGG
jgi:hypothetical protein